MNSKPDPITESSGKAGASCREENAGPGACDAADAVSPAERVRRMEVLYDLLLDAVQRDFTGSGCDKRLKSAARILSDYIESGNWLRDYRRDELGLFPPDLKRGVLSQDGLYDLLGEPGVEALLRD